MKQIVLLLAAATMFAACYEARITNPDVWFLDVPAQDQGTPIDPGTTPEVTDDTTESDVLPDTGRLTGAPCEVNEQCFTEMCLTTEFIQSFYPNIEIPGGMCSMLGCGFDEACGQGAVCLDVSSIADGVPPICGQSCAVNEDCRTDYSCLDTEIKDVEDQNILVCLPDKLITLLYCENGQCDPWEQEHPDACPGDCP